MDSSDFLADLAKTKEINISFRIKNTTETRRIPVWFVAESYKVFLLPVNGSRTRWYQNIMRHPEMTFWSGDKYMRVQARPLSDDEEVAQVINKFEQKYGAGEIQRWYSDLDVAVEAVPIE